MADQESTALGMGGIGGAYFLASPGELVVEVTKRDRHIRDWRTDLRALLVSPDRQVVAEAIIPDDGGVVGSGTGRAQSVRLTTHVGRKGVYALNITVTHDRYGEEIIWGLRTNCPHYLIETSRGHKDEAHHEPIVLLNPEQPGDVCFRPRRGEICLDVSDLPDGVGVLSVYDAGGTLIQELPVDASGQASHTFPADAHRDSVPWRLHLPTQQAIVQIDGVTRWAKDDVCADRCYWSPHVESHFPLHEYRWLLTPYRRRAYGRPGDRGVADFQVHNNSDCEQVVRLSMEFPEDRDWEAHLPCATVEVAPQQTAAVRVDYAVPVAAQERGDSRVCHIRATPLQHPEFSTYSTLTVETGEAPAANTLAMPIVLRPYAHENEQFGYAPDYPVASQMYFDTRNQPYVLHGGTISTCRRGEWEHSQVQARVGDGTPIPVSAASAKVAFDGDNDLYATGVVDGTPALLHSGDGGETFTACPFDTPPDKPRSLDIEQFSGHNTPDAPPPVLSFTLRAADPQRIWRRLNDLELFLPEKVNGQVVLGDPIPVSDCCIGLSGHSGIPSSIVSRGPKVHLAWAEATDPEADVPGVPTYVASLDRETRTLGDKVLVGYGPPPNDCHNSPSITMDREGYLHVVVGTHGSPFPYARSLKPNDAHSGWTAAEPVQEGLRQTYIGLVCAPDDTLHLVYRLWSHDTRYFPVSSYAVLTHQTKKPGQPWSEPHPLVVPPFTEYSVYYHRLTIDRKGRLFLSYNYWSTHWFYRNDHRGDRRALLMSADGGGMWKLASTADIVA